MSGMGRISDSEGFHRREEDRVFNQDLLISSLWNGETVKGGYPRRSVEKLNI